MPQQTDVLTLFSLVWDKATHSVVLHADATIIGLIVLILIAVVGWRIGRLGYSFKHFEIDQAEIGVGAHKLRFRPNVTDRQVIARPPISNLIMILSNAPSAIRVAPLKLARQRPMRNMCHVRACRASGMALRLKAVERGRDQLVQLNQLTPT